VLSERYDYSDIDIIVPEKCVAMIGEFLTSICGGVPTMHKCGAECDYDDMKYVDHVLYYNYNGHSLSFIVSKTTIEEHVSHHDLSIVRNRYGVNHETHYLHISALAHILNKRMSIVNKINSYVNRSAKYVERGFKLIEKTCEDDIKHLNSLLDRGYKLPPARERFPVRELYLSGDNIETVKIKLTQRAPKVGNVDVDITNIYQCPCPGKCLVSYLAKPYKHTHSVYKKTYFSLSDSCSVMRETIYVDRLQD
jgi:hypothetical protein